MFAWAYGEVRFTFHMMKTLLTLWSLQLRPLRPISLNINKIQSLRITQRSAADALSHA